MQLCFASSLVFTEITLANKFLDVLPNMLYVSWAGFLFVLGFFFQI